MQGAHRRRERQGRRQRPQDRPRGDRRQVVGANLTAAKDLVENRNVFAVVNNSPFAFLAYRYLKDAGCR